MTDALPLGALLDSWLIYLHAERKSQGTIRSYRTGVLQYLAWCEQGGRPQVLHRPQVAAWLAELLGPAGLEPATVTARLVALKALSRWLADPVEGEGVTDELATLRAPRQDRKVVATLTDDHLRALLKACKGQEFRDRRDEAIVRLMLETGARAGEAAALELADVDLIAGSVVIRRGKGGKGRTVPVGPEACRAIDRYLRMRRTRREAPRSRALWLGEGGRSFGYDGLAKTLKWRADMAGLAGFHPHLLRHTAATRWLERGGSEGGLMALAGWSRRDLIERYTAANRERLAGDEARRLHLGDL
jgi:site-specific recombinase XerD